MSLRRFSILVVLLTASGCASVELEDAFKGKLEPKESNKVISQYCVTCHAHKDFDPETHVFDVKYRYEEKKYAGKTDCHVCHTYRKNWYLEERRGTLRPSLR